MKTSNLSLKHCHECLIFTGNIDYCFIITFLKWSNLLPRDKRNHYAGLNFSSINLSGTNLSLETNETGVSLLKTEVGYILEQYKSCLSSKRKYCAFTLLNQNPPCQYITHLEINQPSKRFGSMATNSFPWI